MSAPITQQQLDLLTSWKEIASYLGKGVRTVQRWEQQFGLPVRRPNEKAKGIVHATREQLDQWLELQWSQRPSELVRNNTPSVPGLEAMRLNLQMASALREERRMLMDDFKLSLASFRQECQTLARHITSTPPPALWDN